MVVLRHLWGYGYLSNKTQWGVNYGIIIPTNCIVRHEAKGQETNEHTTCEL